MYSGLDVALRAAYIPPADILSADIVPHDEGVKGLPRSLVPHQRALALVGDAYSCKIGRLEGSLSKSSVHTVLHVLLHDRCYAMKRK